MEWEVKLPPKALNNFLVKVFDIKLPQETEIVLANTSITAGNYGCPLVFVVVKSKNDTFYFHNYVQQVQVQVIILRQIIRRHFVILNLVRELEKPIMLYLIIILR